MCELLGAALDAAVARVLGRECKLLQAGDTINGVRMSEARCFTNTHEGQDAKPWWQPFIPSVNKSLAMALQFEHDVVTFPSFYGKPEKWEAGFDISYDDPEGITLDHHAYGATPAIAICRALVVRHEAREAERQAAALDAANMAEVVRLRPIFDRAFLRAWEMIYRRNPTTVFETDEDRQAYEALLEAHRDPATTQTLPAWLKQFFEPVRIKCDFASLPAVGKLAIKAQQ